MTSIQYYHSLLEKDDQETWDLLESRIYGNTFDDDLDNRIFDNLNTWE